MHPSLWAWWRARKKFGKCGGHAMREGRGRWGFHDDEPFEGGGGGFGIRRPLRFLVHKLGLDEGQVAALARILDELKTERAQTEVDHRRAIAAFADALAGDTFDMAKAAVGGDLRVQSAERLRKAVLNGLQQIHAILKPDQRVRFATLIRAGRVVF